MLTKRIPDGGTPIESVKKCGTARASIEFGTILNKGSLAGRVKNNVQAASAGDYLGKHFWSPKIAGCPCQSGLARATSFSKR